MNLRLNSIVLLIIHQVLCQYPSGEYGQNIDHGPVYDPSMEYSPEISKIYNQYLKRRYSHQNCSRGSVSDITDKDLENALKVADQELKAYLEDERKYLEMDPRGLAFSLYVFKANLRTLFIEFATRYLAEEKCLDREETEINIASLNIPDSIWKKNKFCDLDDEVSPTVKCDPHYKYRREDGKCTNLEKTNWGSSFHCQRRLLPPDYEDGISKIRVAADGSPLPNARLITKTLMPDIEVYDTVWTSLKMIWGQFVAHDIFKTFMYFGGNITCCPDKQTPKEFIHYYCLEIGNIPKDKLTIAYNQTCINNVRQTGCRTCSLGHREQLNAATPLIDLSNLYGGNENNTETLRSFKGGEFLVTYDREGDEIMAKAYYPQNWDRIDANTCQIPLDRPYLTCMRTGDGIRGVQQPMMAALQTLFVRRHNYHCRALSKVNPHWSDEIIYQEAKRILIAEYNTINYREYFPASITPELYRYYGLYLKESGFTQFRPEVDPNAIQSVGVAAQRFGHSTVTSIFPIIRKELEKTHGFRLRNKFQEMSNMWDGETNGIIKGLASIRRREVDSFIVTDIKNYLYFKPALQTIRDLPAVNIMRARERGVPGYIYYLQYCSGVKIKHWSDLNQYIPEDYVKRMSLVYKDINDIDLFVGGLAERYLNGSTLGPTFNCLLGIQFHHLKYGDRFYFEHGGQPGSFTLEQLDSIRRTASVANFVCKTTDFKSIQSHPFNVFSKDNPLIPCRKFKDFDYELWREMH